MIPFLTKRSERRLLDDSRRTRSMLWIMAIMVFLTTLAGALGLATFGAAGALDRQLAGRLTVQIVEPDAEVRDARAGEIIAGLRGRPDVRGAALVDRARLAELLEPWLGQAGLDADLPMPAMIDVDLAHGSDAAIARVTQAVQRIAPAARVDRHAQWLSPVRGFIRTLAWIAAGLVVLMASATAAVVLLAARSGLDTHRDTIAVLHMLGSTDLQVARLFQRRIALDTLLGGVAGTVAALVAIRLMLVQTAQIGSAVLSGVTLTQRDWVVLACVPVLFALMATVAARIAVLRALGKTL